MLPIYYWARGLYFSMVCISKETPLEKANFCFVSRCYLEIASWLRMVIWLHSPSQWWDPASFEPVQMLGVLPLSVTSHKHQACCVRKTLFLWSFLFPVALTFFLPPLSQSSLSPVCRSFRKKSYLWQSGLTSLIFSHFFHIFKVRRSWVLISYNSYGIHGMECEFSNNLQTPLSPSWKLKQCFHIYIVFHMKYINLDTEKSR